ncbi:MAG: S-methyl-5-thioribose-1-phosphate isomerase [Armatimonadota bacterium]|nr:S-methyl-5-thioribose-1-phosphate isomerase [Armatimonadota bacterium]
MAAELRPVDWKDGKVVLIDQTKLPDELAYIEYADYQGVVEAIRTMQVRGAPAIGVAVALGIALAAQSIPENNFWEQIAKVANDFRATRPTAVNLFWAVERMLRAANENARLPIDQIRRRLIDEAITILEEDIEVNQRIGKNGSELIQDGDTVLTHCNAGALATAGYGTALGVIRAAVESGKKVKVIADETRPRLQGMRLTAWELQQLGIPVTVITDNMAGYAMQKGLVNCVIVGADRIAANGDVANKIGTYSLAILARKHNIAFYVAAPMSTVDLSLPNGEMIPIEERSPDEVTHISGIRIAPEGVRVMNPAFDVTPAEYVTAIITERGILWPPFEESLAIGRRQ